MKSTHSARGLLNRAPAELHEQVQNREKTPAGATPPSASASSAASALTRAAGGGGCRRNGSNVISVAPPPAVRDGTPRWTRVAAEPARPISCRADVDETPVYSSATTVTVSEGAAGSS